MVFLLRLRGEPKGIKVSLLTALYLQSAVLFVQGIPPEIHHARRRRSYPEKEDEMGGKERTQERIFKMLHVIYRPSAERKMDRKVASKEGRGHIIFSKNGKAEKKLLNKEA